MPQKLPKYPKQVVNKHASRDIMYMIYVALKTHRSFHPILFPLCMSLQQSQTSSPEAHKSFIYLIRNKRCIYYDKKEHEKDEESSPHEFDSIVLIYN